MNTKIVGEIGINHNGDLNIAKQMINVAKLANINLVKFQKRNLEICIPKDERNKMRETPWGYISYMDYKKHLEFEYDDYLEIDYYCKQNSIEWFASPWDVDSVKFLNNFNCPYIKVASACITDFALLEEIKHTNKPVIISTGMSNKKEVDNCINYLGNQLEYILACKSTYPTRDEDMNLKFILTLKNNYPNYRIGFSNHSSGIRFLIAAVVLGAEMVEFHYTLDRSMFGSDQSASIEINGVLSIMRHIHSMEVGMGSGDWIITKEEENIKNKLRRVK